MGSQTKAGAGLVGIVALVVVYALARYDFLNEGGNRYRSPRIDRELIFKVKLTRHYKLGDYKDPRSAIAHWTVGHASGSDAPRNAEWSRPMGKVPPGTYYALFVQPGDGNATVATQTVTVTWGGNVMCGPTEESGSTIPRCDGYTRG